MAAPRPEGRIVGIFPRGRGLVRDC